MRSLAVLLLLVASPAAATPATGDPEPPGGIKGTVIYEGEAPDRLPLDRKADPVCSKTPRVSDDVVVTHGKLAGVVVRVASGEPPPPPAMVKEAPSPVVVTERDCMFEPRVFALEPSQGISVKTADGTAHHVRGKLGSKSVDKAQAKGGADVTITELGGGKPGDVVELTDDVHPWMHAWGVVTDNRFHAVTADDGTFAITGLPPGTYMLEAFHPLLGTRTLKVVIGRGPNKQIARATLSYKKE